MASTTIIFVRYHMNIVCHIATCFLLQGNKLLRRNTILSRCVNSIFNILYLLQSLIRAKACDAVLLSVMVTVWPLSLFTFLDVFTTSQQVQIITCYCACHFYKMFKQMKHSFRGYFNHF